MAGGLALVVLAAIGAFYAESWLLRVVLAAALLIMLGASAYVAFQVHGEPERFYWSLAMTGSVVLCVAISKI